MTTQTKSKKDQARAIFKKSSNPTRAKMMEAFESRLGMSKPMANTYYHDIAKESTGGGKTTAAKKAKSKTAVKKATKKAAKKTASASKTANAPAKVKRSRKKKAAKPAEATGGHAAPTGTESSSTPAPQ